MFYNMFHNVQLAVMAKWLIILALLSHTVRGEVKKNHRQKRILWITTDGRLALPPGTLLTITPTISMPFVRYPPEGFLSNMSISLPFTINFDTLGLTDNQNPYGALPPILARNLGRSAGVMLADYVASILNNKRSARATPETHNFFHGGERAMLYVIVEEFLSNFGLDGKACLLRAICEVQGHSLKNFGFFGEMLKLFFTASKSPFAEVLNDYVAAERQGLEHGECFPYYKNCPKSLFVMPAKNKYINEEDGHHDEHQTDEDFDSGSDKKESVLAIRNEIMDDLAM
ncbi:DM4/DM12 family [Nesidiocoris tenuis]|uniref:DM4/DM12 family n=1 Tax=Nesidiocoris tenuis TaxID=355587 RepID=A0ABN7AGQ7_9HEMI|nr:DM4/DM12 family [Nesidiocoris tenuis]